MEEQSSNTTELPSLLTPIQVSQCLQISRALSYRLLRDGELPSVRIGRVVRVKPTDLQAFIAASTVGESVSDRAASTSVEITAPEGNNFEKTIEPTAGDLGGDVAAGSGEGLNLPASNAGSAVSGTKEP